MNRYSTTALPHAGRLLAMSALLCCGGKSVPPGQAPPPDRRAAVHELAKPLIEDDWIVGMSIGLYEDGRASFHDFGRVAAGASEAPDADTIYEIGSVSKVLTAMLLAHGVTSGELSLDQPVNSLLPEGVRAPARDGVEITLEHLATHRSGLPRLPDNLRPADENNPYADYTVAMLYEFLARAQLSRVPGTGYEYSNLGSGLLGHVLARHYHQSYEQAVRERLLAPLGMDSTAIVLTEAQRARLAQGHDSGGAPVEGWDLPTLAGAGAWRSSARDMLALVRGNLELEPGALAETMRLTHVQRGDIAEGEGIGLGWHIDKRGARWHNGGTGGYFSFVAFDPERKTGVVILTNTQASVVDKLGAALLLMLAGQPYEIDLPRTARVDPAIYDRYAGSYVIAPGMIMEITRSQDALFAQLTGQPPIRIYPLAETRFYTRAVEAIIEFKVDASGKATQLVILQGGNVITATRSQ